MKKDTIAAIATAMSSAGIGIVRISGSEAIEIIQKIFRGKKEIQTRSGNIGKKILKIKAASFIKRLPFLKGRFLMKKDTIAAIATAMSSAGIGIVRISGSEAIEIIQKIFRGKKEKNFAEENTYTIHYGYIADGEEIIDEVLVMLMKAPHSYTGEDTVEIDCHGGIYVVKKIMETVIKYGARPAEPGEFTKRAFLNGKMDLSQAEAVIDIIDFYVVKKIMETVIKYGARPAEPGEFTKRAFLNGKMDLSQAEAVIDIIDSKNEYALKSSVSQLKGSVQKKIKEIREEILYHTAFIETALDDPEHISVDGYGETLKEVVDKLLEEIDRLLISADNGRIIKEGIKTVIVGKPNAGKSSLLNVADNGRIIKEGIKTVIVGKPNAGKSSLLNVLVGEERAIVTDIEGTTRDILEENIQLQGVSLNIMDTAGIRETKDVVEKIGVDKAKNHANEADLIIYVADASRPLDEVLILWIRQEFVKRKML